MVNCVNGDRTLVASICHYDEESHVSMLRSPITEHCR